MDYHQHNNKRKPIVISHNFEAELFKNHEFEIDQTQKLEYLLYRGIYDHRRNAIIEEDHELDHQQFESLNTSLEHLNAIYNKNVSPKASQQKISKSLLRTKSMIVSALPKPSNTKLKSSIDRGIKIVSIF